MPTTETSRKKQKLQYTAGFMREVFRANKSTGAIGPSSRALADAVTEMADLEHAKTIIEYGPGSGVFTEAILERKPPEAYFLALEVNPSFVAATKERCPEARVVEDSAQNAVKYLKEAGYDHCDRIISGLPWSRFSDALQDEILEATYDVLAPGGRFVTFAYATSPYVPSGKKFFRGKLEAKFPKVTRSQPIWKNFPPCVVFVADKA